MTEPSTPKLLTVGDLVVTYRIPGGRLRAVDQVSLELGAGETLAIVGESGCGKSTLARAIMRLVPAQSGEVWLDGVDVLALGGRELRSFRRRFQIVFQDPSSALNDRMTVGDLIDEPLAIHRITPRAERPERVAELLELVGLDPSAARRYPRHFSGGQRQRIAIARALASNPDLLIADEPTSALDVSIQGQILLLLEDLRHRLGLGVLLITHDLAVVRSVTDRVAVMYLGQIVETARRSAFFAAPRHPYSQALLEAAPRLAGRSTSPKAGGEVPSAATPPSGCRFHTRCPFAIERCLRETPIIRRVGESLVACHRAESIEAERVGERSIG